MNLADFLKHLASPSSTPKPIRRMVEGRKSASAQRLKVVENAPKPVDQVTSEHNPATPGGSVQPGATEMEGIRGQLPEIEKTRPRTGKLDGGQGSKGPKR